jgi:hypothetical protein
MKASLKKLRSCAFSKEMVSKAFFSRDKQYNHRLLCDHPDMREHWSENVCVDCSCYLNRNQATETESKAPTLPKTS